MGKQDTGTREQRDIKSEWRTAANKVTLVRIILIPLFVVVILSPWQNFFSDHSAVELAKPWVAAFIFAALALTDGLDGYLARSRNEVTMIGKFLDPIADKLLVVAALLALIQLGTLPSWVALIIIAREFLVSGLRMIAAAEGVIIAASWVGKWKTAVSIVAIILFIVKDSVFTTMYSIALDTSSAFVAAVASVVAAGFDIFAWIVMVAAVVLTVISMVDYFIKTAPLFGQSSTESSDGQKS